MRPRTCILAATRPESLGGGFAWKRAAKQQSERGRECRAALRGTGADETGNAIRACRPSARRRRMGQVLTWPDPTPTLRQPCRS
jgi:hypothetical protein